MEGASRLEMQSQRDVRGVREGSTDHSFAHPPSSCLPLANINQQTAGKGAGDTACRLSPSRDSETGREQVQGEGHGG